MTLNNMRLDLGTIAITEGIRKLIYSGRSSEILQCLNRHHNLDWGDIGEEDKSLNDLAVLTEGRVLSAYTVCDEKVWIITEADRSVTTILLPEEY